MYWFVRLMAAALLTWVTAASAETVGFSQVGAESDWRTAFTADMQAEAKTRGINLDFDDAQGNVERQFAAVRRFIAERVDAIIIAPVVVTGWTPVLKEARAANIPVFIADRSVDAETSMFVTRIGNDTNLEGRLAGSWLAQASRGRCSIVEIQGTIGAAPTIGRKAGFAAVIAQFPGMRIIRSESGDFTEAGGRRVMAEFINSTNGLKDVCAVWAHNDDMMLGAIEVMKSAGLHPGKNVLTISADGVPGIYRAMLNGRGERVGRGEGRHRQIYLRCRAGLSGGKARLPEMGADPDRPAYAGGRGADASAPWWGLIVARYAGR